MGDLGLMPPAGATGFTRQDSGLPPRPRRACRATTSTSRRHARRCEPTSAASVTSSTTSRDRRSGWSIPWAKGLKVEEIQAYYDEAQFKDWTHARHGRPGAQGAAPGVRDVEPGHSRPLRRDVRRLPHAVQARGRAQDQRPPRAQPAAQRQPGVPGLSPLAGGGAQGPGRNHPAAHLQAAATWPWMR